jgi:hypothetical protein
MNAARTVRLRVDSALNSLQSETVKRSYQAGNHLRNASLLVLRGTRSGRRYLVPSTKQPYKASAPGEAPAVRTGLFRLSWQNRVSAEKRGLVFRAVAAIESALMAGKWNLGALLEYGTRKIKPRPYKQAIKDRALPQILALFRKPFKL